MAPGSIPKYVIYKQFVVSDIMNSEWLNVTAFLGTGDSGQQGPYSPYKLCNHSPYIGIIIFPHIDNTQSTGHN